MKIFKLKVIVLRKNNIFVIKTAYKEKNKKMENDMLNINGTMEIVLPF